MMQKYRVHELVKFNYSEIGEYIDEMHTDRPLRNDEIVDLLNEQEEEISNLQLIIEVNGKAYRKSVKEYEEFMEELEQENEQLKQSINNLMDSNDWWEKKAKQRVEELEKENDELKQYKQAVSDILWDWYRKDGSLTIWRIMKELNVDGDVDD